MSDNQPRWPIRWELLTAVGVFGAQLVGIAVWLGAEHAGRNALEERVGRSEQFLAARLSHIEDTQRGSDRDLAQAMEKISVKLEDLRILVAGRLGK